MAARGAVSSPAGELESSGTGKPEAEAERDGLRDHSSREEGDKEECKSCVEANGSCEKSVVSSVIPAPTSTCSMIPYGCRSVPWKVMTEEDYVDTLTSIVEREYFPDLRRLRLLQELRKAEQTGDHVATEVLQLRLGAMTPATSRCLHWRDGRSSDIGVAASCRQSALASPAPSKLGDMSPYSGSASFLAQRNEVGDLWSPLPCGADGDGDATPRARLGACKDRLSCKNSRSSSSAGSSHTACGESLRGKHGSSRSTPRIHPEARLEHRASQIVESAAFAAAQERSLSSAPVVKLVTGEIHQVPSERLSIDTFQALYTTEDNASFDNLMMDDKIKKLQGVEWMYEAEVQHNKAVEDAEKRTATGEKSLALVHNRHVAKTALMFEPDGLLPQLQPGLPDHLRKTIQTSGTRFSGDQRTQGDQLAAQVLKLHQMKESQEERHKAEFAAQAASFKDVMSSATSSENPPSSSGAFWDPAQADEEKAERRRQYVMSPSIVPGVGPDASPLMTWGKIAATPLLLNGSAASSVDALSDIPGSRSTGGESGRTYCLPEQRARDRAAEALMAQASHRVRSAHKRRRQGLEALTSSWVMSVGSPSQMSSGGISSCTPGASPFGHDPRGNSSSFRNTPASCSSMPPPSVRSSIAAQLKRESSRSLSNARDTKAELEKGSRVRSLAARSTLFQTLLHKHSRSIAVDKQLRAAYSGRSRRQEGDELRSDLRSLQSTPSHRSGRRLASPPSVANDVPQSPAQISKHSFTSRLSRPDMPARRKSGRISALTERIGSKSPVPEAEIESLAGDDTNSRGATDRHVTDDLLQVA